MAIITNASGTAWTAASATTAIECWQVQSGCILLSTDAAPGATDGIFLKRNDVIFFGSGQTVRYRLPTGETAATLVRTVTGA